jgi:hypothetical protein
VEAVFGFTANTYELSKFHTDLISGTLPAPHIAVAPMKPGQLACYQTESIYLNQRLLLDALAQPRLMWVMFYALLHECGHHLDDILHWKYLNDRGDTARDEGAGFASRFVDACGMNLWVNSFEFGEAEWETADGKKRREALAVGSEASEAYRKLALHYATLHSGEEEGELVAWGENKGGVEFWTMDRVGVFGGHEAITKEAAKTVGLPFGGLTGQDLEEGCAWPDVPTEAGKASKSGYIQSFRFVVMKQKEPGNIAYESHFGKLQNWHSMCPKEAGVSFKNKDVKERILAHLKEWYEVGDLLHIGKMLHTIQDSFCYSHCWRRVKGDVLGEILQEQEWKIWSFQDYDQQNSDLHGVADKKNMLGFKKAIAASIVLLEHFKNKTKWETVHSWLNANVYAIYPGRAEVAAGESHPWFSKNSIPNVEGLETQMLQFSKEAGQ